MNPKVKSLWTKALRSGKYKKCTGALSENGGFCCLGVLTDLYVKSKDNVKKLKWDKTRYDEARTFEGEFASLTKTVMKWAGLKQNDPIVMITDSKGKSTSHTLSAINDGNVEVDGKEKRFGFLSIADIIQKQL